MCNTDRQVCTVWKARQYVSVAIVPNLGNNSNNVRVENSMFMVCNTSRTSWLSSLPPKLSSLTGSHPSRCHRLQALMPPAAIAYRLSCPPLPSLTGSHAPPPAYRLSCAPCFHCLQHVAGSVGAWEWGHCKAKYLPQICRVMYKVSYPLSVTIETRATGADNRQV